MSLNSVNRSNSLLFFFFQAEDGIRDTSVTGVQTCALPIPGGGPCGAGLEPGDRCGPSGRKHGQALACPAWRSEERRVGKECRSRGWRRHFEKRIERGRGDEAHNHLLVQVEP